MMTNRSVIRLLVAVSIVGLFVLSPLFAAKEYGEDDGDSARILIAYEKSPFKIKLFNSLTSALEDEAYLYTVDHNRGELSEEESEDYDVIVIINAGVNSRVRPQVTAWLKEVENTEKVILLTTYRDRGWSPRYPEGVDSITSPSKTSAVSDLTDSIIEKVNEIIG